MPLRTAPSGIAAGDIVALTDPGAYSADRRTDQWELKREPAP
ncbi:hypothetical protein [Mycolicibacterium fortuitum]|nr:hypothetical protein [Mycolicibacterium fortuitum]